MSGGLIASYGDVILDGDFDQDEDVDGLDAATLANNPGLMDLETFSLSFGKLSGNYIYFYDGNGNVSQLCLQLVLSLILISNSSM